MVGGGSFSNLRSGACFSDNPQAVYDLRHFRYLERSSESTCMRGILQFDVINQFIVMAFGLKGLFLSVV